MMKPRGVLLSEARALKEPRTMTASQINKELDALDKVDSKLTDEFIAAGRGRERPSEIRQMTDPLATRAKAAWDRRRALQVEIAVRYGPREPSRLPIKRGWYGPRKEGLGETGYDVTAGPKERRRREKAERERQAHHAAQKAKYGDDPNAPAQDARARAAAKRAARRAAKKPVQEADVDIRRLERLVRAGDLSAVMRLAREKQRRGVPHLSERDIKPGMLLAHVSDQTYGRRWSGAGVRQASFVPILTMWSEAGDVWRVRHATINPRFELWSAPGGGFVTARGPETMLEPVGHNPGVEYVWARPADLIRWINAGAFVSVFGESMDDEPIQEADVDIRRLERLAALGDAQAATKLRRARLRAHRVSVLVSGLQGARDRARGLEGPLRAPHYTASTRAVMDELGMAQGGVLYLDELEGFSGRTIETLARTLPGSDVEIVVSPRPKDEKYAAPRWDKNMSILRGVRESIEEADVDIRRLERLAAAGDAQAASALARARERAGLPKKLASVYGYTQSGKPMRAIPVYGTGQRMSGPVPELRVATSGWTPQDLADASVLAGLYAKKRGKDKQFSKTGFASDARFSPEGLGFKNQASALHDLLREHPDVVASAVDRPGVGSGIGWAAVVYTDSANLYYRSFFRGAAGKKLYTQRYFEES